MLCVVVPYTFNSMTSNIEIVRRCVSKILKDDIHQDLGNHCSKTCSWIPLTKVKSFLLNSALLEIRTPALPFSCSFASSALSKIQNPFTVAESANLCGFHLQFAESKTTSYIRLLRNPRHNKYADKIYVTLKCSRNPRKFYK